MGVSYEVPWNRLERWSPIGFIIGGGGFLCSVVLLLVDAMTAVTVPELALSAVVIPSLFALSVFGLPGFYPYVADASPRLALAGGIAGVVAGAVMLFQTVAKTALHVLGVVGFTEDGPLIGLFFVLLFVFFLSVLFYGIASLWTGEPSRLIGALLLLIVVEPGSALLNDVLGLDLGITVLYVTLAIAGVALFVIGYQLRSAVTSGDRTEPTAEVAT